MKISLTPELEQLVSAKVQSGMYPSVSEVICDGLRLLAERDEIRRKRIGLLDREIQAGFDQAARGELCEIHWLDSELDRTIAEAARKA